MYKYETSVYNRRYFGVLCYAFKWMQYHCVQLPPCTHHTKHYQCIQSNEKFARPLNHMYPFKPIKRMFYKNIFRNSNKVIFRKILF